MFKKYLILLPVIASFFLSGCLSVPLGSIKEDVAMKKFSVPPEGVAGLYIYRRPHSSMRDRFKKQSVYIDGELIGATLPNKYFYKEVEPGSHEVSTGSEFGKNDLTIYAESGKNYFVRQYAKMGIFSVGFGIELVKEEEGKSNVLKCKLAK